MKPSFELVMLPRDKSRLVDFLTSETWPYHVNIRLNADSVLTMIDERVFDDSNHQSFWIQDAIGADVGFIRLIDLDDIDDGYPLFDIRIRASNRGQGFGKASVEWLTEQLFKKWPELDRIAGTTRVDNKAMRGLFRSCGYVKEGHYRNDWPSSDGQLFDTVKYAILREDWEAGTTTPVLWDDESPT